MKKINFIALQLLVAGLLLVVLLGVTDLSTAVQAEPQFLDDVSATYLWPSVSLTSTSAMRENPIVFWDNVALFAIRTTKPGPPVVARALAIVHTAMYEAWSQYDITATGTLLGAKFRQPATERTAANKSKAISYAAYRVLVDLFPTPAMTAYFANALETYGYDFNVNTTNVHQPAGIGNLAAAVVITYRHHDGANQLGDLHAGAYSDYTGYQPVNPPGQINDLNHWQPLRTPNGSFQGGCLTSVNLITQTYVGPHWGQVIPFALDDGPVITPTVGPARYPSPEFSLQAREVLSLSAHLTDREKVIAEYWADGPASELPPGHWALISQFASARDQHTLDDDAKLFFGVTNANLDAGILAWKVKRIYDSVRPITAIRELFRGQQVLAWAGPYSGTQLIAGETWQPYQQACFVTPAFPEYISGHSSFSAASAEVLRSFTGSDAFGNSVTVPAGSSQFEAGQTPAEPVVLSWATFSEAADQAGLSRRYGGIHFERGDLVGRALGRQVGARVWQKALTFFDGTGAPVADMTAVISKAIEIDDITKVLLPNRLFLPIVVTVGNQNP